MTTQKEFPLSTLINLSYESCDQLKTLRINTVQAFVARTSSLPARETLRTFLRLTEQEMDAAVNEAQRIVPIQPPEQQFAAGALVPPNTCTCMMTPCPHTTKPDGTVVNGVTQEGFLGPVFGAMIPPGLEWQEGKTAGEIALINFMLRTYLYLRDEARPPAIVPSENGALVKEAEDVLQWYGVPVPEWK
jgi:hypothetical protein